MATGSVPITAGAGTPIRIVTNPGVDSGADQQVFTAADQYGNLAPSIADGTPSVETGATSLLIDAFDSAISNNWTTAGTAAPTATSGNATFVVGTTVSATSYMGSIATFALQANTFLQITALAQLEAAVVTNSTRWWGYGTNAGTPTAAAPITNGVVFIQDYTAGVFYGAVYSAGTRTQTLTLTRPSDGGLHRYQILFKQSRVFFVIDGVSQGSLTSPNMAAANNLQLIAGIANFTTGPATAPTFTLASMSMADPGKNNTTISDGTSPWRKAAVKAASTAVAATDTALVVGLHPSSPIPAGTNTVGAVAVGATTRLAGYYTSTTTNTAQTLKASAGDIQTMLIANNAASTQYVKLFNATGVTLGATAAVMDIPVAAAATITLNLGANGLRMTTGIIYAVTGAAGLTNNTAGAGGVSIAVTYV